MCCFAETDTAHVEITEVPVTTAALETASNDSALEDRWSLRLYDE